VTESSRSPYVSHSGRTWERMIPVGAAARGRYRRATPFRGTTFRVRLSDAPPVTEMPDLSRWLDRLKDDAE